MTQIRVGDYARDEETPLWVAYAPCQTAFALDDSFTREEAIDLAEMWCRTKKSTIRLARVTGGTKRVPRTDETICWCYGDADTAYPEVVDAED